MGKALMGHKSGETVTYTAPNGKDIKVQIGGVKPYTA
ncbi:GreA/GreB family elongation factor [Winkia neuii]